MWTLPLLAVLALPVSQEQIDVAPGPWQGSLPGGWETSAGAVTGDQGADSRVLPIEGGLALEGDAATARWQLLARPFALAPDHAYRLTFEERLMPGTGTGRFDDHWIALEFLDAAGKRAGLTFAPADGPEWLASSVAAVPPKGAVSGRVAVFLDHPGRLEVRALDLRSYGPEDSFDLLAAEMDRHYSHFPALEQAGELDWSAYTAKIAPALRAEKDPEAFAATLAHDLLPLHDVHVWIDAPVLQGRKKFATRLPPHDQGFSLGHLLPGLVGLQRVGRLGFVAHTRQGFGYVLFDSFQVSAADFEPMEKAFLGLFDLPGIVIDLRKCSGGDELLARRIVGHLTAKPVVFARTRRRSGPAHDAFGPARDSVLEPAEGPSYTGPVAVLIGPQCVSSGERMVQMLRATGRVFLVGRTTCGASGNPAPLSLPNGVVVWYSRWVDENPDGTPVEGQGIAPDLPIPFDALHRGGGPVDKDLSAATAELARRLANPDK